MTITAEELEQRLSAVEQELARLKLQIERRPADETPAERGARLLRESLASQSAISAAAEKAFDEMGISGAAVGIEKLREMMLASGVDPTDNSFSREIIAMRDE
ncbi:MAG: hypothetical protein JNM56_30155 [Planctomycetia bacterium]|nr:hypothetical protein [Planctomycetia bacterium]